MTSLTRINIFTSLLMISLVSTSSFSQNATVTLKEDSRIPEILTLKKDLEKNNKLTVGYTIQLYYGDHTKANGIIKKYRNRINTWPASIEYETPNYKVWVGNFPSRLEADRAMLKIKETFPSAFILKPER